MIFFNIPSVGQLKPDTLFGEDDHFGFIRTLVGEVYNRNKISKECEQYYNTSNNRYWDQIITLINFLAIKKLSVSKKFERIPLIENIADEYDQGNTKPSEIIFNYLLCQWQYPHPILTNNGKQHLIDRDVINIRRDFPIVKPYQVIISVLNELKKLSSDEAYLSNMEFYRIGYNYFKNNGKGFNFNSASIIAKKILTNRQSLNLKFKAKYESIEHRNVHLSYPKGFLKNSFILTDDITCYPNADGLFIGLKKKDNIESIINSIINYKEFYDFDRNITTRNNVLATDYSDYLYNPKRINNWLKIFNISQKHFPTSQDEKNGKRSKDFYFDRIKDQLNRLNKLEKVTISKRRTEQHILRKFILKNNDYGVCAICNKEYPVSFLATAHIKKRKDCNDKEKLDLNVVMPACHLGCDKLYEEGYIFVKDGNIIRNSKNNTVTDPINKYVSKIVGTKCKYFNERNKKYFEYHAKDI